MGAALAVLGRGGPAPLRLTAAKSRLGHSEPVSGTLGLVQSVAQLTQGRTNALLHLRHVNPMVSGLLSAHASAGHAAPYLPRADAPGLLGGMVSGAGEGEATAAGVSAFAFQGTNAHALLCTPGTASPAALACAAAAPEAWQRRRHWFAPTPHALLPRLAAAAGRAGAVHLQAVLGGSALAYLQDHRVGGRALFPGAAMFEAAHASAMLLLEGGSASAAQPALAGLSIPAPLVLAPGDAHAMLHTTLDTAGSGALRVQSSGSGGRAAVHLAGTVARAQSAAELAGRAASVGSSSDYGMPSPALVQLVAAASPAGSLSLPSVVGCLEQSPRHAQGGSYHLHPALIDCTTQVTSALNSGSSGDGVTRVPVGVAALVLPSASACTAAPTSSWWAGGLVAGGDAQSGSIACSYSLVSAAAWAAGIPATLAVDSLLVKPTAGPEAAAAAAASAEAPEHMMYALMWLADSAIPATARCSGAHLRHAIEWRVGAGTRLKLRPEDSGADFLSVQASLRVLLAATASGGRPPVALHTPLLMPGLQADTAASYAAAAGLLKVAAQENRGQAFGLLIQDGISMGSTELPEAETAKADCFGVALSEGALITPLLAGVPEAPLAAAGELLVWPAATCSVLCLQSPTAFPAFPPGAATGALQKDPASAGSVIITGGLGDIGSLAGAWVAAAGAARVWLLGRSGRAGRPLPLAAASAKGSAISALSCDVATAADVAGLSTELMAAPIATCVLHAGGVLADALLPRQTATSLRTVYAPKVSAHAVPVPPVSYLVVNRLTLPPFLSAGLWSSLLGRRHLFYAACHCRALFIPVSPAGHTRSSKSRAMGGSLETSADPCVKLFCSDPI